MPGVKDEIAGFRIDDVNTGAGVINVVDVQALVQSRKLGDAVEQSGGLAVLNNRNKVPQDQGAV